MAAAVDDDGGIGFEEGMFWLPSHVLDEACDTTKVYTRNRLQKVQNHQQMHQQRHHKSPRGPQPQHSKSTTKTSYQRPRLANAGPGMQAIFLGSTQRSCGTGVFLPQRANTNFQPSKKPACAPVLLPARVVEALNLNVHALGVQISPPQVDKCNPRCGAVYNNNNSTKKKRDKKDAPQQCTIISQNHRSSSPEIFLPKEWTY